MRILFLLLLLCNVMVLLWYTQLQTAQNDEPVPALGRNVKSLVLLNETRETDNTQDEKKDSGSLEPSPESALVDEKPLPEITILSEQASNPDEPVFELESEPEPPLLTCHTIGPFTDIKIADNTLKKLEKLDIKASQRSKTESEISGYRVFLPPYKSRDAALNAAKQLAKAGILDYFVITEGEIENGISLGLFRDKSGAIRRMAQIRRFDFKPAMEIRHRDKTIYWLDYEQRGELLSNDLWQAIREETPQIQALSRECQ